MPEVSEEQHREYVQNGMSKGDSSKRMLEIKLVQTKSNKQDSGLTE